MERHYRIEPNGVPDEWMVICDLVPRPASGIWRFQLDRLTEQQAHQAGIFARMNEDVDMDELYELTEQHLGRDVLLWGWRSGFRGVAPSR